MSNEISPAPSILRLPILAGILTCDSSRGVYCRFLDRSSSAPYFCRVFGEPLKDSRGNGTGSPFRAPECLEAGAG